MTDLRNLQFTTDAGYMNQSYRPEMFQKHHAMSFLGRRSMAPRPLSEATEIYDTDIEDDEYSPASLATDSTRSSYNEAITPPLTAGLGGFEFHFDDKSVEGPYGPHLFLPAEKKYDGEIAVTMSPVATTPKTSVRNITALKGAVAELDEDEVRCWSSEQVADWMAAAGFDSAVVDKFLVHDICGTVLLDLQFEDLKELDINSFGKRHQVMTSIQNLRNSIIVTSPVTRRTSHVTRTASTRRGRFAKIPESVEEVMPTDSASIVAIEQVLPKPHRCSKGEDCPKWQRQQRKIQRLEEQLAADVKSIAAPSVVAASDVFGPTQQFAITSERLSAVEPRDPLERVRNFLDFQHMNSPSAATFPQGPAQFVQNLNGLPKLTIPTESKVESPYHTPISAFRHPTEQQAMLKAQLIEDPYHYGGVASPVDVYRIGSPMSATDIPVTALPTDPCPREVSHSVPPEMKFGSSAMPNVAEVINRPRSAQSTSRRARRPSFVPNMTALSENMNSPALPPTTSEVELVNHRGWMRQRKTTRMMKHEWQDHYCTLSGTQLGISRDQNSKPTQAINVEDYTLHAYTTASSSKLSAAFKKSLGSTSSEPTFAFSLIPEVQRNRKGVDKEKSHHFAVNSGSDRVEWMRKLMLAKVMKKNDGLI